MKQRPMQYDQAPTAQQVQAELDRERYRLRYRRTLRSTLFTLLCAAAAAVLVATLGLPVLQIYGSSMTPTLSEGEIVLSWKSADFRPGDIVAFYYGNSLLIKRYIAGPGSWVDIREDGTVLVDGTPLDEPYLSEKALGSCDIELPYQVPEGRYFLLGDHRATSVDSRHTAVGCIAKEQIVGKVLYRVWPLSALGAVR